MKPVGIQTRVLLAALLPVTVVATVLALVFIGVVVRDLDFAHRQRALALARQLASASEFAVFTGNQVALQGFANGARQDREVRAVMVLAPGGDVLVRAGTARLQTSALLGKADTVQEFDDPLTRQVVQPIVATETPVDALFEGAPSAGRRAPYVLGYVVLELSRESVAQRERELLAAVLIATVGGLLFGYLIAVRLSAGVTRPILEVFRAIERFGKGDLSARVNTGAASPLRTLEEGINRMAERIERNRDELEDRVAEATAELRLKKEEAERANRSKSRFLAAASHDLRQPIHALRLFIGILSEEIGSQGRAATVLSRVQSSIDATSAMFDALLDISKLEAGVIETNIVDFPIRTVLRRLEMTFAPLAAERGLRFKVVPSSVWVRSDPALLDRLLQNLVSNAIKYTASGSVVLGCRRRPGVLSVEVLDSGPGIAPEHQQEIFHEFFQLENPARESNKGLGLGLAIVERICLLLGHRLRLESAPGLGSRFAVELPYGRVATQTEIHRASQAHAQRFDGVTVAVLDDDPMILQAMQQLLERWGCVVRCGRAVPELLAALHAGASRVDLLLCDYRLESGATGIAAVEQLRAALSSRVPAILITGDTAPDRLREAHESGLELLHKPVEPERLRAVLHRALANRAKE